jgi:hypothetical protein
MNNVAAIVSPIGVNSPASAVALQYSQVQPAALSWSATISQYFIGGMMLESASPMQQNLTIIEIRPYRNGWQCFEAPGVQPYWTGKSAKVDAIGYAKARAKFERGEIRVLNKAGVIEEVIQLGDNKEL